MRLPPFGPAANGLVAYEERGDVFTADPVTGVAKSVVTGTQLNLRPVFSRDGTHFVFERKEPGLSKIATEQQRSQVPGRLVVARSDGSGAVVVTPEPVTGFDPFPGATAQYTFSSDGTQIALWSSLLVGGGGQLWIAQADGSGMRQVDTPLDVVEASYLPPDGAKLIVTAGTNGGPNGIFALDPRTGQSKEIVAPDSSVGLGYVRLSPDGSRLAYVSSIDSAGGPSSYRVHVIGLDGTNDVVLPLPAGSDLRGRPRLVQRRDAPGRHPRLRPTQRGHGVGRGPRRRVWPGPRVSA